MDFWYSRYVTSRDGANFNFCNIDTGVYGRREGDGDGQGRFPGPHVCTNNFFSRSLIYSLLI